jgi:hypothetical protein
MRVENAKKEQARAIASNIAHGIETNAKFDFHGGLTWADTGTAVEKGEIRFFLQVRPPPSNSK